MKKYTLPKLKQVAYLLIISLTLSACGSYQYAGSTSDGIYEEDSPDYTVTEEVVEENNTPSDYYSNYFKEENREANEAFTTDEVFTDVEDYQSTSSNQETANAGWGENSSNVNIHVYNNVWNNRGWNYLGWNNYGWTNFGWSNYDAWYNPYNNWNYGYRWNNWGWNNWGWNSPFYGNSYNNFGYGYYGNYRYRPNYAYSYGRRGYLNNGYFSRRGNINGLYSRNRRASQLNPRSTNTRRSTTRLPRPRTKAATPRTTRPRVNSSRPRTNSPRANSPRPRTNTPRSNTPRPRRSSPRASAPRTSSTRRYSPPRRSNNSYSAPRSSSTRSATRSSTRRPR